MLLSNIGTGLNEYYWWIFYKQAPTSKKVACSYVSIFFSLGVRLVLIHTARNLVKFHKQYYFVLLITV